MPGRWSVVHSGMIEIIERAVAHADRQAMITPDGTFTYRDLVEASAHVASALLGDRADLAETRVAFLMTPGYDYVTAQWGIWRAGGIAVPLATSHPVAELERVVRDCSPEVLLYDDQFTEQARAVAQRCDVLIVSVAEARAHVVRPHPDVDEHRAALIVYTSGTTGRPKGAVSTHRNVVAQIASLIEAWGWTADDRTMLVLPLHHVHGMINVLACALWAGASIDVRVPFDASDTWDGLSHDDFTVFTAVPTIYRRLIAAWDQMEKSRAARASTGCYGTRLFVSGSAALPVNVLQRWLDITGHVLLERYGTTETGMVLSNPLHGERRPGHVGGPLPDVEVRLVNDGPGGADADSGEILVRSPSVFREYWNRPEETTAAFADDWYRTGDIAVVENGAYRIVGRASVDIIKTGGYKVSALEIEEVLREHPAIGECAVVGVPDDDWGERVCVAIEGVGSPGVSEEALREWAKERLAPYKIPRSLSIVDALPRNAMGKVMKTEVQRLFDGGNA